MKKEAILTVKWYTLQKYTNLSSNCLHLEKKIELRQEVRGTRRGLQYSLSPVKVYTSFKTI
jgi:hypothetical protein